MKKRELERHLTAHGCQLTREATWHELWENPATGQRTTIPRHQNTDDARDLPTTRSSASPRIMSVDTSTAEPPPVARRYRIDHLKRSGSSVAVRPGPAPGVTMVAISMLDR